jgi:hypothetical protein
LRHKGNFKEGNLINWLQPKTGGYEWNSGLTVFLKNRYIRLDNELLQPNSICHGGVIEEGVVLEFTVETQSNNLTYHQPYTKRQQITYKLIKHNLPK